MTFKISLDSSVIISHLSGDIHKDDVLACVDRLASNRVEVFMSLVCYAEVWTGIELQAKDNAARAAVELQRLLQASGIMLVADNVSIARDAARAQADYRRRGGRREVLIPDFLIGANAAHYSGRLLNHQSPGLFWKFPSAQSVYAKNFLDRKWCLRIINSS